VYYEHCSYFSAASLGRLFQTNGLDVQSLELVYSGQYLHLLASPENGHPARLADPAPVLQAVQTFQDSCSQAIARWHALLQSHEPGRVALWGSGSKATGFLTTIGSHDRIDCVVDINPDKHGRFVAGTGHEIVAPKSLQGRPIETLIIMNPVYTEEITAEVRGLGLNPRILAL
jgi:hypothetical protein